jgi:hypothetical protein
MAQQESVDFFIRAASVSSHSKQTMIDSRNSYIEAFIEKKKKTRRGSSATLPNHHADNLDAACGY